MSTERSPQEQDARLTRATLAQIAADIAAADEIDAEWVTETLYRHLAPYFRTSLYDVAHLDELIQQAIDAALDPDIPDEPAKNRLRAYVLAQRAAPAPVAYRYDGAWSCSICDHTFDAGVPYCEGFGPDVNDDREDTRHDREWNPARDGLMAEVLEATYPCEQCGRLRTRAEGGTIFTVCDECWDAHVANVAPAVATPPDALRAAFVDGWIAAGRRACNGQPLYADLAVDDAARRYPAAAAPQFACDQFMLDSGHTAHGLICYRCGRPANEHARTPAVQPDAPLPANAKCEDRCGRKATTRREGTERTYLLCDECAAAWDRLTAHGKLGLLPDGAQPPRCDAPHPKYTHRTCTLPPGHEGEHVARDIAVEFYWDQETP